MLSANFGGCYTPGAKTKAKHYSELGISMKFHAFTGNLRSSSRNGFIRAVRRVASAALLSLMLSVAAAAYTIVLKGGRRIEIPSNFIVTSLTLTCEAAPGLNVTLMMSTIDIPATEHANNEVAGSFLKRAGQQRESNEARTQSGNGRRELTQADIERGRLERQRSEEAYERRRKELGLPSLEEARRRTDEETKRLLEESQKNQAEQNSSEAYWRERATQLRTEMAVLDAQINYVRAQLAESPDYSAIESYALIGGASQRFFPRRPIARFPIVTGNPGFMRGANGASGQGAGFLAFGGSGGQPGILFNGGAGRRNFGGRVPRGFTGALPVPYIAPDYYDRDNLISRLHELEAARVGWQARWRALEEEARRAGAQPGWLRP